MKRKRIKAKGKYYYYTPVEFFDPDILRGREVFHSGYLNVAFSFDIETTSYYSEKYKKDLATMYIWQCGIDKYTIIGRTWEEFVSLIEKVNLIAEESQGTILCLIQNLSFEFQFLKGWFNWNIDKKTGAPEIFAKNDRQVLYAKYKNIEFRDTLALTDMGLARYKKNYGLSIDKLVGDLDYSLYRHYETQITNEELSYCINDVQILNDWYYKYLVPYFLEVDKTIPLTATGLVRQDLREEFAKLPKKDRKKLQTRIRNAQPTEDVYKLWRAWLFRGGYVHANVAACNFLCEAPFVSEDLKSAHPAQMLLRNFPWKFNRRNKSHFDEILSQARSGEYAFFGIFKFYDITASTYHTLESKSKIIESALDTAYENGRLIKSSFIKVCLTDIDFFNYELLYRWSRYEVTVVYQARYEPLPDFLRKTVMKYFILKETLPKDTPEYNNAKRRLNSCFGCCATSLPERSLLFNKDENNFILSEDLKEYDELIRWLILIPQWAIWIAAYTRNDIVRGITEDGSTKNYGLDCIYYDTDSLKVMNWESHKEWFENFNNYKYKLSQNMETYGYDKKYFSKIGQFDYEYTGERFKVLGAKRYLVEHDGKIQCTVAGMVKGSLEKYCEENNLDIWEQFTDNLILSPEFSKKQTTIYTDTEITDEITDYIGKTLPIYEKSCVAIISIPFTMSVEVAFLDRIKSVMKERRRMVHKGIL